jgi:hypothetical protein
MGPKKKGLEPTALVTPSPESQATPGNLTNLVLKNLLANLSATDSWHDFHSDIAGVADIIKNRKDQYINGLPIGVTELGDFNDEGAALDNIIQTFPVNPPSKKCMFSSFFVNSAGNTCNQAEIPGQDQEYYITTQNGIEYGVKSLVVATGRRSTGNKEYIESKEFMDKLGIANKSAFVIDAAAVSVLEILKSGNYGNEPKPVIYYAYIPEVVNDAATKTPIDGAIFNGKDGVNLRPCLSNIPPSFNYNYSFDQSFDGNNIKNNLLDNYKKFFTRYNFQLSELQINLKGKSLDITTNLKITNTGLNNNILNSEPVTDSKKKNNITFLHSLLLDTIKVMDSLIGKQPPSPADVEKTNNAIFLFNTRFQQKRSGDWLQVLACLILKTRELKVNNPKGPATEKIQNDISDVYFVTHDRIALAFALLCGVQCIYTHAATKAAYIFKLPDTEEKLEARKIKLLEDKRKVFDKIILDIGASVDGGADANSDYKKKFLDMNNALTFYNGYRKALLDRHLLVINAIIADISYNFTLDNFNVDQFSKFVSELFSACLELNFILFNLPDLEKQCETIRITNLAKSIRDKRNGRPTTDISENELDGMITSYNSLMNDVTTFFVNVDRYCNNTAPVTLKINMDETLKSFRKSPGYKLASGWSWSNTSAGTRIWDAFKDIVGNNSYKSDKNSFLYNLDLLPAPVKVNLSIKFDNILTLLDTSGNRLKKNTKGGIADLEEERTKSKFLTSAKGFCAEVFINFGKAIKDEVIAVPDEIIAVPDDISYAANILSNILKKHVVSNGNVIPNIEGKISNIIKSNELLSDSVIVSENSNCSNLRKITITTRSMAKKELEKELANINSYTSNVISNINVENIKSLQHDRTIINVDEGLEQDGIDILQGGATTRSVTRNIAAVLTGDKKNNAGGFTLVSNFETDIKSTTYVLLNASLSYKKNTKLTLWESSWGLFHNIALTKLKGPHENRNNALEAIEREKVESLKWQRKDVEEAKKSNSMEEGVGEVYNTFTGKTEMKGGAPIFTDDSEKAASLTELAGQLKLEPTPETEQIPPDIDLLLNGNQFFHPMLPIYMIAESLNEVVNNSSVEESLEYELYLNYLNYLTILRDTLHESYQSKKNVDIAIAYIIGDGVKELLFNTDVYSLTTSVLASGSTSSVQEGGVNSSGSQTMTESSSTSSSEPKVYNLELTMPPPTPDTFAGSTSYCESVMGISKKDFLPVQMLTDILRAFISGYIIKTPEDILEGKVILNSTIFKKFMKNVNTSSIFNVDADTSEPIESFKQKTFKFLIETGNIIITDRGGVPVDIPPDEDRQTPSTEELRELRLQSLESRSSQSNSQDTSSSGNSSPPTEITQADLIERERRRTERANAATSRLQQNQGKGGSRKILAKKHKRTIKRNRKTKRIITTQEGTKIRKRTKKHKN